MHKIRQSILQGILVLFVFNSVVLAKDSVLERQKQTKKIAKRFRILPHLSAQAEAASQDPSRFSHSAEALRLIIRAQQQLSSPRDLGSRVALAVQNSLIDEFAEIQINGDTSSSVRAGYLRMNATQRTNMMSKIGELKNTGTYIITSPGEVTEEMLPLFTAIATDYYNNIEPVVIEDTLTLSGLETKTTYYVARTTKGKIIALPLPNGVIKFKDGLFVSTETAFEHGGIGRAVLEARGYSVEQDGIMQVIRSDRLKMSESGERITIRAMREALAGKRHNNVTLLRVKAEGELLRTLASRTDRIALIDQVSKGSDEVVGFGKIYLKEITPTTNSADNWKSQSNTLLHQTPVSKWSELLETDGDQLLHLPYDSMKPVIDLLKFAASNSEVKELYMSVYRTSDPKNSEIVAALEEAVRAGKEITLIVEIKARGNEERNLQIIERLQRAASETGNTDKLHLIFGNPNLKVHAKAIAVVFNDGRHITNVSTGNYREDVVYGDIQLFTSDDAISEDIIRLFKAIETGTIPELKSGRVFASPHNLASQIIKLIDQQIELGRSGRIVIKTNSLMDKEIIAHLERATEAGVTVDLIVREANRAKNLKTHSELGRNLEHARLFTFGQGDNASFFMSSFDPRERNIHKRYELMVEVTDPKAIKDIKIILEANLKDTHGLYVREAGQKDFIRKRPSNGKRSFSAQEFFQGHASMCPAKRTLARNAFDEALKSDSLSSLGLGE